MPDKHAVPCIGCDCCLRPWNQGSDFCDNCLDDSDTQTCHACEECAICGRTLCDMDCQPDRPLNRDHYGKPIGSVKCHGKEPSF